MVLIVHVLIFAFYFDCCCVSCSFVPCFICRAFHWSVILRAVSRIHNNIFLPFLGEKLAVSPKLFAAPDSHVIWVTVSMLLFGGFLAVMISISEFLLLSHTSSLTLSIAGIFKVSQGPHSAKLYENLEGTAMF